MNGTMIRKVRFHGFTIPKGATVEIRGYSSYEYPRWSNAKWEYVNVTRHNASIVWNGQTLGVPKSAVRAA